MDKHDKKIIEFIEKFIKPAVIEVCDHLGPFWYSGKPEEYHTRALAYELNDRKINFDIDHNFEHFTKDFSDKIKS